VDEFAQAHVVTQVGQLCERLWEIVYGEVSLQCDGKSTSLAKVAEAVRDRYCVELGPMIKSARQQVAKEEAKAQAELDAEEAEEGQ